MPKHTPNNILKTPLYGNCRVEDPGGVHIFNCGHKKAQWYLKRGLAEKINEKPFTIKLTFVPHGSGHIYDNFYLQERQNICVCCGSNEQLTRHHVVPFMYRRYFPKAIKNHSSYDILPLCYTCHEDYEAHALRLKKKIAEEMDMPNETMVFDAELKHVCMAASALLVYGDIIPAKRYTDLMSIVNNYYVSRGKTEVTIADIEAASRFRYTTHRDTYKPEGQVVVENLDNIESFAKRWREHFVITMIPRYLPDYWTIERPL